jgi:hypothetical protein
MALSVDTRMLLFIATFPTRSKFVREADQEKLFAEPEDPSTNRDRYMDYDHEVYISYLAIRC